MRIRHSLFILFISSLFLLQNAQTSYSVANKKFSSSSDEDISFVLTPRPNQGANILTNVTYSAINTVFDKGLTNCRAMVYANATKAGDEYIDITSIKNSNGRLEILVLDGETNEHLNPFLVDKDGRTYIFGSTDGLQMAGSAYYERVLDVKNVSNNKTSSLTSTWAMNTNTQFSGLAYQGVPVNKSAHNATTSELVYYHLNLNTYNYRSGYTEWAAGLNLAPSGNDFDFANVKLAGFYMNKQHADQTNVKWDIKVLSMSVRSGDTGQRIELFNAENTVMTTSNATLWNDRVDQDGKSYVYQWVNNAIASNVTTTIEHGLTLKTESGARPLSSYNNGEFTLTRITSDSAWLWAFAKEYERFSSLPLDGYEGTVFYFKNDTGKDLKFDWYFTIDGTNHFLNNYWLFGKDGTYHSTPINGYIPTGFEGYVYSLFEQNATFLNNLSNVKNETRFVLHSFNSSWTNKTFSIGEFKVSKNIRTLVEAKLQANRKLDEVDVNSLPSEYRDFIESQIVNGRKTINLSNDVSLINQTADDVLSSISEAYVESVELLIDSIGEVTYTKESKDKIDAARNAFNSLSEEQKLLVDPAYLDKLIEAENTYQQLQKDAIKAEMIDEVVQLIALIGEVTYTPECKEKIDAARSAYESLDSEYKADFPQEQLQILINAENKYLELEDAYYEESIAIAEATGVVIKIHAIGTVYLDEVSKLKIDVAREAYDALSDLAKSKVSDRDYQILLDAEARYQFLLEESLKPQENNMGDIGLIIGLAIGATILIGGTTVAIVFINNRKRKNK